MGEGEASAPASKASGLGETARDPACRLDTLCGRKGLAWETEYSSSLVVWRPSTAPRTFELSSC
jgi:hypothetical protein